MRRIILTVCVSTIASASPHPDPQQVPNDSLRPVRSTQPLKEELHPVSGRDVLRVRIDWDRDKQRFELGGLFRERSGTPALLRRSKQLDKLGSYRAALQSESSSLSSFASIGTGHVYRRLTRSLSFRFPLPNENRTLIMTGENPLTGKMESIFSVPVSPEDVLWVPASRHSERRIWHLKEATASPKLLVNLYAEGYESGDHERFIRHGERVVQILDRFNFPGFSHWEVRGVFVGSVLPLGDPSNLGEPIPERASHLGLYYPYWYPMKKWEKIVYPTREERLRRALGAVPYDYAIALVDSDRYWGMGNYNALVAIPMESPKLTYLLLHELGHFFGLNEEYNLGGRTELEFAPGIREPWSQNISFLPDGVVKWRHLLRPGTPVPTPDWYWRQDGRLGAYRGGYAESEPQGKSHIPGRACTMSSSLNFCTVCRQTIEHKTRWDLGSTF